jgi:hypothetical protein
MSASGHRTRTRYATCASEMSHTRAQAMQPNTRARRYCCQRSYVWKLAIIAATHAPTDSHERDGICMYASDVSRPRSRAMCIDECSHLRKTFTRVAKLSVSLYTCLRSRTNCRDAQTRTYKTVRKAQLTSCIYVANLMQLRRCEWRYVACAPPRSRFRDNSRINNPEGERV